ncbi:MAG: isovaleryl-CoA dehydrogenase [Burkholderiales bacterium]
MNHPAYDLQTHDVTNQPPPLENFNLFNTDHVLREAVKREGADWAQEKLSHLGAELGRAETLKLGTLANQFPPQLKTHDRFGNRRDEVEFHPAWHELMTLMVGHGVHAQPWAQPREGAHVARTAAYVMHAQVENGTQCPLTMTYAVYPMLKKQAAHSPWLRDAWLPKIVSTKYDPRFLPVTEKTGALIGMGMTEKQGGSDVRTNTTRATLIAGSSNEYRITGHKWFFSAPMCDGFLVLAQASGGLSCFFMPRFTPDGELNAIRIQRLKDKLGNKSNASSEVEFFDAYAILLGEEGRGVPTILEMGTYTRLDCAIGSAGLMRMAVAQATHHARHRMAFGKKLSQQPLMQNVLADLALESEAATALVMRLARAFDKQDDESEAALRRLLTPAVKYWVCKRGPVLAAEAMEVVGGNGYVEESVMPRIYREMPLNSIWEGSGNVMCLDVLRAAGKTPHALQLVFDELAWARSTNVRFDEYVTQLKKEFADDTHLEFRARKLTEMLCIALQGSLLVRFAPAYVADTFCASRLGKNFAGAFGALPPKYDFAAIIARATPIHK